MEFDRNRLKIRSLGERVHDLTLENILPLKIVPVDLNAVPFIADSISRAREHGCAIIMFVGGHVIRSGVQRYIIDMMKRGYISCIAMNGAGLIHDFEFALIGATTENVARYIAEGQFGLWRETGQINDIINEAYLEGSGMGEAAGRRILEGDFPNKEISLLAAGYALNIPVTIHMGIGYDIIHEHPNCDGAAVGATSYKDFLRAAKIIERLDGGVVMSFGSAVMAPEVFLKALSMARNVAIQDGRRIQKFTALVCDIVDLPEDFITEPSKENPAYYFRPWKTMLVRTVAQGGRSFYIKARHSESIPQIWSALKG